jgi:hypothetical protein
VPLVRLYARAMLMTIIALLAFTAFIATIVSWGWGKPPLHLAVLCLVFIELFRLLPLGK